MTEIFEQETLTRDVLIAQLRDASAYPHTVDGPVVVHETHISLIFLAGHFAYKIKKPITTHFLDYGTLAKRHHACCEELRLDSRYVHGLYLDVVPITYEDGQLRMDVQYRGRTDLSGCFINAYLEQTGDYEALPILRWYMLYRALVRAKVAKMSAEQAGEDAAQRSRQNDMATLYLNLSHQLIQPKTLQLWITHGVSGSGKTTGSQQLVCSEAVIRLRSDIERKRLFRTTLADHLTLGVGHGIYSASASESTYQALLFKARKILQDGFSVVIDGLDRFHGRKNPEYRNTGGRSYSAFGLIDISVSSVSKE